MVIVEIQDPFPGTRLSPAPAAPHIQDAFASNFTEKIRPKPQAPCP